ncbi:hypothetical protein ACJX0J_007366 [Zea mays]
MVPIAECLKKQAVKKGDEKPKKIKYFFLGLYAIQNNLCIICIRAQLAQDGMVYNYRFPSLVTRESKHRSSNPNFCPALSCNYQQQPMSYGRVLRKCLHDYDFSILSKSLSKN